MTDFIELQLESGVEVIFESAEGSLVRQHGGEPVVERYEGAMRALNLMAETIAATAQSFREKIAPDEIELQVGIGLSGEVGWFFAKSALEASITMKATWKKSAE